ncbi:unnamed protein product [Cylicocyclus nassatus]|uniref:G-protein coupled receptors family 1 profile domain-containing protein n=1 Tax=Cylicocyclus nassatus TaxID=53992 RepID=A0AA36H4Z2_CYLNA|nr:unnamed protein product [Cylicocyclus nassatus]
MLKFFTTSLIYVTTWIIWQSLAYMPPSIWMFVGTITPIGHAINPTIYLIFNKNLRRRLSDMIWGTRVDVTLVSSTGKMKANY